MVPRGEGIQAGPRIPDDSIIPARLSLHSFLMSLTRHAAVITISDSVAVGTRPDLSGAAAKEKLEKLGYEVVLTEVVPDEINRIADRLKAIADAHTIDLVVTTGGTGLGPRDVTPEATQAVIDKSVPGLAELMRAESSRHTRFAFLSRALVGVRGETLIVNLPGSPKGVVECFDAIQDLLPHALNLIHGKTKH